MVVSGKIRFVDKVKLYLKHAWNNTFFRQNLKLWLFLSFLVEFYAYATKKGDNSKNW